MPANQSPHDREFTLFIEENQQSFYRLTFRYVKNPDTAMDIIHEAIIKAIDKYHTLRDHSLLKPWFYRILVNEALGYLRKNKRLVYTDEMLQTASVESSDTHLAENLDLYHAIDQLDPKLKTIIMLRFFEDMKLEEISIITQTNINTVKSRLYKALKELKPLVSDEIS